MSKMEKKIVVKKKQGLHARPAAVFVQIANKYLSSISVRRDAEEVNGKSIMGILMLGADKGCEISLAADGQDAESAMKELEDFLAKEE